MSREVVARPREVPVADMQTAVRANGGHALSFDNKGQTQEAKKVKSEPQHDAAVQTDKSVIDAFKKAQKNGLGFNLMADADGNIMATKKMLGVNDNHDDTAHDGTAIGTPQKDDKVASVSAGANKEVEVSPDNKKQEPQQTVADNSAITNLQSRVLADMQSHQLGHRDAKIEQQIAFGGMDAKTAEQYLSSVSRMDGATYGVGLKKHEHNGYSFVPNAIPQEVSGADIQR
jgi:hypothetical protein